MHIAIVHGYYLGDSGSGVYVRNLASGLLANGHDVTLVCQERSPERYDIVGDVWTLDDSNTRLEQVRSMDGPGRCRLVRPNLNGRLLVFVDGPFPGFDRQNIAVFQDAPDDWIATYAAHNITALRTIFDRWPPDLVLAQHSVMQPFAVMTAIGKRAPYVVTTHGSEVTFSLRRDPRLAAFAVPALDRAHAVVALSPAAADDVASWARSHDLDLSTTLALMPPGLDTTLFEPAENRAAAVSALREAVPGAANLDLDGPVLAIAGRVGANKGMHHAVVAASLLAVARPHTTLLVAGAGPAVEALSELARLLAHGKLEDARALAEREAVLETREEWGALVPPGIERTGAAQIAFLGHLAHEQMARMFAAADVALAPSTLAEAAALVTSEALASGALPVVTNQSGLSEMAHLERDALADPQFLSLVPGIALSTALAERIDGVLGSYPTRDPAFRRGLHAIAATAYTSWREIADRYVALGTAPRVAAIASR
jgi:glycosyltransferase involved in cell wall biosynthesis